MSDPTGIPTPPIRRRRRRPTITSVLGEVLITASALLLLFVAWQVWWSPAVASEQQTRAAGVQSKKWIDQAKSTPEPTTPADDPPIMQPVKAAQAFGVLYAPRFGENYKRVIKETVDEKTVLNDFGSGIGHYPGTQMPGEVGNFAIAGHDTGWGNALIEIFNLRVGDKIYIQTKDGWYTYQFRNFEYVQPDAVSVLWPVPRLAQTVPTDRLLTITTCNPPWRSVERLIAYAVFDSWQPISAGPPAAIATAVNSK